MRIIRSLECCSSGPWWPRLKYVVLLDFAGRQGGRVREQLDLPLAGRAAQGRLPGRLEKAVSLHNGYLGWTIKVEDARPVARELGAGTIVGDGGEHAGNPAVRQHQQPLSTKRLALSEKRLTDRAAPAPHRGRGRGGARGADDAPWRKRISTRSRGV